MTFRQKHAINQKLCIRENYKNNSKSQRRKGKRILEARSALMRTRSAFSYIKWKFTDLLIKFASFSPSHVPRLSANPSDLPNFLLIIPPRCAKKKISPPQMSFGRACIYCTHQNWLFLPLLPTRNNFTLACDFNGGEPVHKSHRDTKDIFLF